MIVIPAVDIKNGKCVRLLQGRKDAETVFFDNPVDAAAKWADEGAVRLHVVDLDGAFEKSPRNIGIIHQIVRRIQIPVQVGGGIRDQGTIEAYLDKGVEKVIIGTEAIRNPALVREACKQFPGKIIVGIDARNGLVAIEGWTQTTAIKALELAKQVEDFGVAAINFTDIHRDGMQTGPNIGETRRLAQALSIPVVASGGVSSLEDIKKLLPLKRFGVAGVITGKALYTGSLVLQEAISYIESNS